MNDVSNYKTYSYLQLLKFEMQNCILKADFKDLDRVEPDRKTPSLIILHGLEHPLLVATCAATKQLAWMSLYIHYFLFLLL